MNIFYTNACPLQAAHEHNLVHMRKMIVEYAQLLSSAHHMLDGDKAITGIYRKTHANHPSAIWARKSSAHYEWVWFCAMQLCENYTKLTGKVHKTESILCLLADFPASLSDNGFIEPPAVVDDEFKLMPVIKAYQSYLVAKFQEWLSREKPIKVEFINRPSWA